MSATEGGPVQTKNYRRSLLWVGGVVTAIGVYDTVWDVYNMASPHEGSVLAIGPFVLAAGVLLLFRVLWAARVVAFCSGFCLGLFGAGGFLYLTLVPGGLVWAVLRGKDLHVVGWVLLGLLYFAVALWLYLKTGDPGLPRNWEETAGPVRRRRRAWVGLALGIVVAVPLVSLVSREMRGAHGRRAIAEARQKLGGGYEYFAGDVNMHPTDGIGVRVEATVLAFNAREIKRVEVGWRE